MKLVLDRKGQRAMKVRPAVVYQTGRGKRVMKLFTTSAAAEKYFKRLDALGKVAQWGDFVPSPLPMLLQSGESKAYTEKRNAEIAEAKARRLARDEARRAEREARARLSSE